ncbi:MAG: J domain-containing protein [Granulosicoccus sp.]|nr:J domain-containing protein [Granulosicoccus sp.]
MNSSDQSSVAYKSYYELLELDDKSDWEDARSCYRRMVHLWHPDKFSNRPRERAHAQQRFIALTKSYHALRSFYRIHGHLPFERVSAVNNPADAINQRPQGGRPAEWRKGKSTDSERFQAGLLADRGKIGAKLSPGKRSTYRWLASGTLVILATITFFIVLDSRSNKARLEAGREIVKEHPESEFLQNEKEARKMRAREKFLTPPK